MEKIEIYRSTESDRECPHCKSIDIPLQYPYLRHNRTELHIKGHCADCGCSFKFVYILHLDRIEEN